MKFQKEDISKAFKTTPFEDSLLVFQAEKNAKDYIEFALLSLPSNQLNEQDICQWIDSIDRFKDCYLYEQGNPLRIRLKNSFYPIEFYDNPKINSLTDAFQWLELKGVEFDVQKPPMFRVIVIEAPIGQIFCLEIGRAHV